VCRVLVATDCGVDSFEGEVGSLGVFGQPNSTTSFNLRNYNRPYNHAISSIELCLPIQLFQEPSDLILYLSRPPAFPPISQNGERLRLEQHRLYGQMETYSLRPTRP
jgi:hypothetical protein